MSAGEIEKIFSEIEGMLQAQDLIDDEDDDEFDIAEIHASAGPSPGGRPGPDLPETSGMTHDK